MSIVMIVTTLANKHPRLGSSSYGHHNPKRSKENEELEIRGFHLQRIAKISFRVGLYQYERISFSSIKHHEIRSNYSPGHGGGRTFLTSDNRMQPGTLGRSRQNC